MPIATATGWYYPLMVTVIPGGSAGAHTVPGAIDTGDTLVAVRHMSANLTTTDADLKAEFSITAANTIDNTAGTDTTGAFLVVVWAHKD